MSSSSSASHWCYHCVRFVRVRDLGTAAVSCPDCGGGFLEDLSYPPPPAPTSPSPTSDNLRRRRRRVPATVMWLEAPASRRRSRPERSPFNPVVVLRSPPADGFEFFYDDGAGTGLRPLPSRVSDVLMGSGFDRLLEQLAQVDPVAAGRPPASKSAVESMPEVEIGVSHLHAEAHCAVCKEPFDLGATAREMPCKHIYHDGCILPWLSMRNSCPVCRFELPCEEAPIRTEEEGNGVGLTIWRLPGGGFAVGRFVGGRRAAERDLPVVYTEMDGGGFGSGGTPRRVSWDPTGRRHLPSGPISRAFRGLVSVFRRSRRDSVPEQSSDDSRRRWHWPVFRGRRRPQERWEVEDGTSPGGAMAR